MIAVPTAIFALRLLVNHRAPDREGIDIPGLVTGSLGLFALVYGFSNAESHSWTASATIVALAVAPVLLITFVLIERRSSHPLPGRCTSSVTAPAAARTSQSCWPRRAFSACSSS